MELVTLLIPQLKLYYNTKGVLFPKSCSTDLARFLGYLHSEGYLSKNYIIGFCNLDEELLEDYSRLVLKLFGVTPKMLRWGRKTPVARFCSKKVFEFLKQNSLYPMQGIKSHCIRIPQIILNSPREVVVEYLRGYFAGDGSFMVRKTPAYATIQVSVEFCSASEYFPRDLQILLLQKFGMLGSLSIAPRKGRLPRIRLVYNGYRNIMLFASKIGFSRTIMSTLRSIQRLFRTYHIVSG